jgi:replication factor C subunit 3/5
MKKYNKEIFNTLPWIEKYRPDNLEEVVAHKNILAVLKNFIKNKTVPHLLFHGPSGTGKTSVINACAEELYGDYKHLMVMQINASEERGIDIVRNTINQFTQTKNMSFNTKFSKMFKLIILDEVDAMTQEAQGALRMIIEKYTENTRFCLICNYIEKINLAIQSRCVCLRFLPLKSKYIKLKLKYIIEKENINIIESGINTLIKRSCGDMRKVLNNLQALSKKEKITSTVIDNFLGYPNEVVIKTFFSSLTSKSLEHSLELLDSYEKNSYQLTDLMYEIHNILISLISNKEKKLNLINVQNIIEAMSIIEFNTSVCIYTQTQTYAFISLFKVYPIFNI